MARAITLERGVPRFSARPRVGTIAKHAVLIVVAVLVAYPFYFMLSSSLKPFFEAIQVPPTLFPHELHPENYADAWSREPWARYFANTFLVESMQDGDRPYRAVTVPVELVRRRSCGCPG